LFAKVEVEKGLGKQAFYIKRQQSIDQVRHCSSLKSKFCFPIQLWSFLYVAVGQLKGYRHYKLG